MSLTPELSPQPAPSAPQYASSASATLPPNSVHVTYVDPSQPAPEDVQPVPPIPPAPEPVPPSPVSTMYAPTLSAYHAFVLEQNAHALSMGMQGRDLHEFVDQAALDDYWRAVEWWPKDIPAHPVPTLEELAFFYPAHPEHKTLTLMDVVRMRADKLLPVLEERKLSVVNPNESYEDRTKRLNRERVAAHRHKKALESENPQAALDMEKRKDELRKWIEVARTRMAEEVSAAHEATLRAQEAFYAASAARKELEALWRGRIRDLRDQLRTLR